jgi:hypothetical protein
MRSYGGDVVALLEIVVEVDEEPAETAQAWLRTAMRAGMGPLLHPLPVVIEVAVGRTWGPERWSRWSGGKYSRKT